MSLEAKKLDVLGFIMSIEDESLLDIISKELRQLIANTKQPLEVKNSL